MLVVKELPQTQSRMADEGLLQRARALAAAANGFEMPDLSGIQATLSRARALADQDMDGVMREQTASEKICRSVEHTSSNGQMRPSEEQKASSQSGRR